MKPNYTSSLESDWRNDLKRMAHDKNADKTLTRIILTGPVIYLDAPKPNDFEIGNRVCVLWTFKADGSYRNGTLTDLNQTTYTITFDGGRVETCSRSIELFHLYDLPSPSPHALRVDAAAAALRDDMAQAERELFGTDNAVWSWAAWSAKDRRKAFNEFNAYVNRAAAGERPTDYEIVTFYQNRQRVSLYELDKRYEVTDVTTLSEFCEKYYKTDRYTGRGQEYVNSLLASKRAEIAKFGHATITNHSSKTGTDVTFYPDQTSQIDQD